MLSQKTRKVSFAFATSRQAYHCGIKLVGGDVHLDAIDCEEAKSTLEGSTLIPINEHDSL